MIITLPNIQHRLYASVTSKRNDNNDLENMGLQNVVVAVILIFEVNIKTAFPSWKYEYFVHNVF